jgi:hypothetical protein
MGLSSSSSKTTQTPVYAPQLTAAAGNVSSAYSAAAPGIASSAQAIGSTVPGLIDKYTNGDPTVNAAQTYDQNVLNGQYLHGSPELDNVVDQTNNHVMNNTESSLGTRGLTGGSAYTDIIARALAQNETGLRYQDYQTERNNMNTAAQNAPSQAAASYLPLTAATAAAGAQQAPVQAAAGMAASTGGLLGQYVNSNTTQTQSIASLIAAMAGSAAQAYAGR